MAKPKVVIIDGDILCYKTCVWWEKKFEGITDDSLKEHVERCVVDMANTWLKHVEEEQYDEVRIAISGKDNFRKIINPNYKAQRKDYGKPLYIPECEEVLLNKFGGMRVEHLEADDLLSIWQRDPSIDTIMISEDKDLLQCGGKFIQCYRSLNKKPEYYENNNPLELERIMYTQWLVGDRTDNLMGCPNVGPVKAERALRDASSASEMYEIALGLFRSKKVPDEVSLAELKCIRLLRDWDEWEELKQELFNV